MRLTPTPAVRARARRPGLSLMEVILSLAILVMSLSALGLLINMGTDHEMNTRLANAGTRLAQSKLAEVEAGIVSFDQAGQAATAFENEPDWTWTMTAEDQGKNLWLVTVTVRREVSGKPFEMSVAQLMLDPAVRGSASKLTRPAAATSDGGSQ